MLVLCDYEIMGCGRSKPGATKDGSSDNDQDGKSKKSKSSKHDRVGEYNIFIFKAGRLIRSIMSNHVG